MDLYGSVYPSKEFVKCISEQTNQNGKNDRMISLRECWKVSEKEGIGMRLRKGRVLTQEEAEKKACSKVRLGFRFRTSWTSAEAVCGHCSSAEQEEPYFHSFLLFSSLSIRFLHQILWEMRGREVRVQPRLPLTATATNATTGSSASATSLTFFRQVKNKILFLFLYRSFFCFTPIFNFCCLLKKKKPERNLNRFFLLNFFHYPIKSKKKTKTKTKQTNKWIWDVNFVLL